MALSDAERMPPPPARLRNLARSGSSPPAQSREGPSPLFSSSSYHTSLAAAGRSPANIVSGGESAPNTASMAISPLPTSPTELAGRFGAVLASSPKEEARRVAPRALSLLRIERAAVHQHTVQELAKELATYPPRLAAVEGAYPRLAYTLVLFQSPTSPLPLF